MTRLAIEILLDLILYLGIQYANVMRVKLRNDRAYHRDTVIEAIASSYQRRDKI